MTRKFLTPVDLVMNWTDFTPTIHNADWSLGSGTASGRYCKIGKICFVRVHFSFAADSTFGTELTIDPVIGNASAYWSHWLNGMAIDNSAGPTFTPLMVYYSGGLWRPRTMASPSAPVTSTAPFTWATSDKIGFSGVYELA